jgi:membrane protein YdbS with pleckstrin-like domain
MIPNHPDVAPPVIEESADVADGLPKELDPRSVRADTIGGWISTAILSGLSAPALVAATLCWLPTWMLAVAGVVWLLFTGGLVWLNLWQPRRTFETTRYIVRPDGLEIHRGIFWKSIVNVQRSRVQHTDVTQGPVLRRFGLAMLTVYTAGNHMFSIHLSGVAHETAVRIRDYLLRRDDNHAA